MIINSKSSMSQNTILIDVSLTGGRGAAKKSYEFIRRCQEEGVRYALLTSKDFAPKLQEFGITPDFVVKVALGDRVECIQEKYLETLKSIPFDALVRFGARMPGPTACLKLGKPFVIVDGGLPDVLEPYPSLYNKEAYQKAKKYIITSQFPWRFPLQLDLMNVEVGYFTLSKAQITTTRGLRGASKRVLRKRIEDRGLVLSGLEDDWFLNLMLTDDYVADALNRKTYGGWLNARDYDACVGFVRRLITDIGIQFSRRATLFLDRGVAALVADLAALYKNITLLTYGGEWDYELEILLQAYADVNISRAANYQPFVALLGNGGSVTTPVPADGYMNEDAAAYQLKAFGMTEVIEYDDEDYVKKLFLFAADKERQERISVRQIEVSDQMVAERNSADIVLNELGFLS